MDETWNQEDAALSFSDGGPLRQVRDPGGLESEDLTLRSGNILRGRSQHTGQMSETQASLESNVTAAQDQSGLSHSESPPVLLPIVTTAEQRRAVLSQVILAWQRLWGAKFPSLHVICKETECHQNILLVVITLYQYKQEASGVFRCACPLPPSTDHNFLWWYFWLYVFFYNIKI